MKGILRGAVIIFDVPKEVSLKPLCDSRGYSAPTKSMPKAIKEKFGAKIKVSREEQTAYVEIVGVKQLSDLLEAVDEVILDFGEAGIV